MYICVGTEVCCEEYVISVRRLCLENRAGYEWVAVANGEETVLVGGSSEKWISVDKLWENEGFEYIYSRAADVN